MSKTHKHIVGLNGTCTLCGVTLDKNLSAPTTDEMREERLRCLHCGTTYPRSVVHHCTVGPAATTPEHRCDASMPEGHYTVSTSTGISAREYGCFAGKHEPNDAATIRLNSIHVCKWCRCLYWTGE